MSQILQDEFVHFRICLKEFLKKRQKQQANNSNWCIYRLLCPRLTLRELQILSNLDIIKSHFIFNELPLVQFNTFNQMKKIVTFLVLS